MDIFANYQSQLFILLDVAIAVVLGGFVGLEREAGDKPAGLRTNMIIAGAAALLISLGRVLIQNYSDTTVHEVLQADPIRIMEAVIVGISFIGAGTILKVEQTFKVRYLTTAASILFSAGIGMSVGLQQYILAFGLTLLAFVINVLMNKLEKKLLDSQKKKNNSSKD